MASLSTYLVVGDISNGTQNLRRWNAEFVLELDQVAEIGTHQQIASLPHQNGTNPREVGVQRSYIPLHQARHIAFALQQTCPAYHPEDTAISD
jgi:hypothetical protein